MERKHILVVDDDVSTLVLLQKLLLGAKYRVTAVEDGKKALKVVRDDPPDLAILDLIMPGMDGVETIRRIKQISPRSQVVVLTSYHEDIHIFPALKAGAISYILKDVKMERLVEALHRAVQGEVTLHPLVAKRVLQNMRSENPDEQPLFARPRPGGRGAARLRLPLGAPRPTRRRGGRPAAREARRPQGPARGGLSQGRDRACPDAAAGRPVLPLARRGDILRR